MENHKTTIPLETLQTTEKTRLSTGIRLTITDSREIKTIFFTSTTTSRKDMEKDHTGFLSFPYIYFFHRRLKHSRK